MRHAILALVSASGLALSAGEALAETWSILEGHLTDAATGRMRPLTGAFGGSSFEPDPPDGPSPIVLVLDDFALTAGGQVFTPAEPIEFEGLQPVAYLSIADQIHVEDEAVTFLRLRSGGDLVAVGPDQVTFRILEFRADASHGGRAFGQLGDTALPRRLELAGTLVEILQSFGLPGEACGSPPGGGSPGGGGVVIGGGGVILFSGSFEIGGRRTFEFQQPSGSGAVVTRLVGRTSSIQGELQVDGSTDVLNPAGVVFDSTFVTSPFSVPGAPALEELGIRAPDGAEVTLDAAGALVVRSTGDLFVEGTLPGIEIPGLTSVTLTTSARIVVTGRIALPEGVSLNLNALQIELGGEIGTPGGSPVPGPVGLPNLCNGLHPIRPAEERVLGSFSLVASAAQPVEIDVKPESERNRIRPGSQQVIAVALFGSRELHVRDIDPGSLRLGDGEAEPISHRGRPWILRQRLNRDRYADLVAFFRVRDAEVAFGDSVLCLSAETEEGAVLEGCDAVDTRSGGSHLPR